MFLIRARRIINPLRTVRMFSSQPLSAVDKASVDVLMKSIDMDELKKFNPKLHKKLSENPEVILDLK